MACIKFRFTTECEMTLYGQSYEDIYLQFKDFMHGNLSVAHRADLSVYPPETVQMFFSLEQSNETHEIPLFKGDFRQDIIEHCRPSEMTGNKWGQVMESGWGSSWYPS
ncbi:hypothetical protein [Halioxenophilus sp. WMMB6]|uniref:hypothetical protein n=1 Tax=Halioxenophilus sp. WMMB6 TaxID=3073815 RepID=UPI00295F51C5|nr:hypothetical protein [Halioxenophilus sp. WMMB6]